MNFHSSCLKPFVCINIKNLTENLIQAFCQTDVTETHSHRGMEVQLKHTVIEEGGCTEILLKMRSCPKHFKCKVSWKWCHTLPQSREKLIFLHCSCASSALLSPSIYCCRVSGKVQDISLVAGSNPGWSACYVLYEIKIKGKRCFTCRKICLEENSITCTSKTNKSQRIERMKYSKGKSGTSIRGWGYNCLSCMTSLSSMHIMYI